MRFEIEDWHSDFSDATIPGKCCIMGETKQVHVQFLFYRL
jgi:hypothetical protein